MPAVITGSIAEMIAYIEQQGGRAVKVVNDQLEIEAHLIYREIFARIPVEAGNVEAALKIDNSRRKKWAVYIDMAEPDNTGKYTVGDYAPELNESPDYKLGEKSFAKGPDVGPKFMERGLQAAIDDGIIDRCTQVLRDAVAKR